jgi:predicted nucleic-acid-binding protein
MKKNKIFAFILSLLMVLGLGFGTNSNKAYAANSEVEKIQQLQEAIDRNEIQKGAAILLIKNNPTAIEPFKHELIDLLKKSQALIKKAKKVIERYASINTIDNVDNKTSFVGTLRIFTTEELIEYQGLKKDLADYFRSISVYKGSQWAVLSFDKEIRVEAINGDGYGTSVRPANMVLVGYYNPNVTQDMDYARNFEYIKQFSGQRIKVKTRQTRWPSDASLPYGQPRTELVSIIE